MYLINQKPQPNNTSLPDQVNRGYQNTGGNQTTRGIPKYRVKPENRGGTRLQKEYQNTGGYRNTGDTRTRVVNRF